MLTSIVALALAFSLLAPGQSKPSAAGQGRDTRTRDVYVSVLDAKGAPVPGLTPADLVIKEDGVSREVLKVTPATEPMQIALVVDDSQASTHAIQPLREGLNAFIDKMAGKAEIGLISIGERPTSLVQYTTDVAALKKGVGRIFARPGSGAYLTEGLLDVSKGLQKRNAARPAIVAITFTGAEFSNQQYQQVLDPLLASGATLHVLEVGMAPPSNTDEMRNRNMVIAEGTAQTGGRRDQLLADTAIPERMKQLADELSSQYLVTYARPESLIPPEKISVTSSKPGLTVRARTRAASK
ncbi:MAG TPA: VWA domain-containing protein [Vicinamibacterales bacterium]